MKKLLNTLKEGLDYEEIYNIMVGYGWRKETDVEDGEGVIVFTKGDNQLIIRGRSEYDFESDILEGAYSIEFNDENNIDKIILEIEKLCSPKIINLTPHVLNLCDGNGEVVESFESQGQARVKTFSTTIDSICGFDLVKTEYGETDQLPDPKENTYYVVSLIVLHANPNRTDLVAPDTSPSGVVRFEDGRIKGVRRFTR